MKIDFGDNYTGRGVGFAKDAEGRTMIIQDGLIFTLYENACIDFMDESNEAVCVCELLQDGKGYRKTKLPEGTQMIAYLDETCEGVQFEDVRCVVQYCEREDKWYLIDVKTGLYCDCENIPFIRGVFKKADQ